MDSFHPRWAEPLLLAALRAMPVVVVTGARQTGKTTLARHSKSLGKRRFFTLDQIDVLEQAQRDPESLLAELPVTIDEVQRAPQLLLAIKKKVDEHRVPGAVLLTGSANLALFDRIGESLAGRAYYLELPPFCPAEWMGQSPAQLGIDQLFADDFQPSHWSEGESDWAAWCLRGGYPDVLATGTTLDRDFWFGGYVQTYLERDLRQIAEISNLVDFQRLMRHAALRTSRLLNQSALARDAGLPQATAHRYLNLLETGYKIARLENHQRNPGKSQMKAKKLHWNDVGLAAWLAGIGEQGIAKRADAGFWLEQTVFQSLQSWRSLSPRRRVHYWRDGPREVDFILEDNGRLVAVDVKMSRLVGSSDLRGIRLFQAAFGKGNAAPPRGVVLHAGAENRFLGDNCYALSLNPFCPAKIKFGE